MSVAKFHFIGAAHFDEVGYLFSMKIFDFLNFERPKRGTASYRVMEQMTEMWTNFAACGYVEIL